MKRGRRSSRVSDSNSRRGRNANDIEVHYLGPSFSDLPNDILQNILFRLSIKSIFVCKSVCKAWYDLISEPEFAKLHFDETCDQVYPLIHTSESESRPEKLYLAQPNKGDFELKLDMCEHPYSNPGCACNVKVALDTKFDDLLLDEEDSVYNRARSSYIVNSCNGLLCLSRNNLIIICNPVTGEFVNLPHDEEADSRRRFVIYGFGFSHVTNQYKTIKIRARKKGIWAKRASAQVHTLGTEAWRDISSKPGHFIHPHGPAYHRGFLYWFSCLNPFSLIAFDIENECFGLDLGPEVEQPDAYEQVSVGVLGGELCISLLEKCGVLHVWAAKDYGVGKAWSKAISIDMYLHGKRIQCSQPMKYLSDGSLLMFYGSKNALLHVDPKKHRFRYLKIRGKKSKVKDIVAHVPSLVSLKHSLPECSVKVLNLRSRCEPSKLHRQTKDDVHIVEEEFRAY